MPSHLGGVLAPQPGPKRTIRRPSVSAALAEEGDEETPARRVRGAVAAMNPPPAATWFPRRARASRAVRDEDEEE